MQALRFHDRRDVRLEQCDVPTPGSNQVRIRVTDAGLSQTQINEFIEGPYIINHDPHPMTGVGTPLIPCQEYGGVVESVGEGVDSSWIGTQVAALPLIYCGKCEACVSGQENRCSQLGYFGLLGGHGGFAEYSVVPVDNITPVEGRDRLTFIEPLLIGIHAGHRVPHPLRNQSVLVLGAGAVGCAVAAVLAHYFGADVAVHDVLPKRQERARAIGLETINPEQGGYDCVVDAAGQDSFSEQDAYTAALNYLKVGGILLQMGTYFHPIPHTPSAWLVQQASIIPSFMYNRASLDALDDVLATLPTDFSPLITDTRLERVMEDGYFRAEFDKDSFTRLVVRFDG